VPLRGPTRFLVCLTMVFALSRKEGWVLHIDLNQRSRADNLEGYLWGHDLKIA